MIKTKEYRENIAQEFLKVLQEKELDWKKGWHTTQTLPVNAKSGKNYKGLNRFYLSLISMINGYQDPRWATFNQIKDKGWRLQNAKGKGVKVEYWYPYDIEERKMLSWEEFTNTGETFGERYLLRARYATVFNAAHISGIPPLELPKISEIEPDELIARLSQNMEVEILHDGKNDAYYNLREDKIHLPLMESFKNSYEYDATCLHELSHATGAPNRLNRNLKNLFGSENYAYEELIAEISSCFMSQNLSIEQTPEHIQNHKAYVKSWIQAIKEKPETLVLAIQQAEKVASYMEYKAELIPKEEYQKLYDSTRSVSENIVLFPAEQETQKKDFFEQVQKIEENLNEIKKDTLYLKEFAEQYGIQVPTILTPISKDSIERTDPFTASDTTAVSQDNESVKREKRISEERAIDTIQAKNQKNTSENSPVHKPKELPSAATRPLVTKI